MTFRSLCVCLLAPLAAAAQSATVPLILEGNVPMIDVEFVRPDGSTTTGRFVVDSGGGAFILSEKLANAIGLKPSSAARNTSEGGFAPAPAPQARVGGMPLDLKDARVLIQTGGESFNPRDAAEGLFPGHVLERYHVIFDYPARKFTLAAPGSVKPRGVAIDSPVRRQNGFARIQIGIAGGTVGFLLDTGASFTMISRAALEEWSSGASPWPKIVGAAGPANMGAASDAQALMARIPEMRLGDFAITGAGAVSRPLGTYEKSMTNAVGGPILGAIGGNVLCQFRVEIDYAGGKTYFTRSGDSAAGDLDLVGLTLSPGTKGSARVTGVSPAADKSARENIRAGDLLRTIDGAPVAGLSLMQIVERLRGRPGDAKRLGLERDGKAFEVQTAVTRIL
jgi:predicted aspartyl protease